ncbi:MAG TPA: OmpA family protein [Alteraurantiacibacter sp.]
MTRSAWFAIAAGALLSAAIAISVSAVLDRPLAERISARAETAIADTGKRGITATFTNRFGWPTRHPLLGGAEELDEATRAKIARAVAAVPGVGGVSWADGTTRASSSSEAIVPLRCQDDVEALLRARTIRFEEGSANIDAVSLGLVDEVAAALRPCLGSIIAITGHTDTSGPEPGNLALSRERANAVLSALVQRGIPADGLRARGVGSAEPVPGLDSGDPANRRIEFSVIATVPVRPTPVDTPGPR